MRHLNPKIVFAVKRWHKLKNDSVHHFMVMSSDIFKAVTVKSALNQINDDAFHFFPSRIHRQRRLLVRICNTLFRDALMLGQKILMICK